MKIQFNFLMTETFGGIPKMLCPSSQTFDPTKSELAAKRVQSRVLFSSMGLKLVVKYGLEEGDFNTRELSMGQDAAESNGRPR
jgi:hypothetical protein